MNYSDCHKNFAWNLNLFHNINYQDILEHPESYLGPNYKEVLNWWFYWDSLSDEQWAFYWDREDNLEEQTQREGRNLATNLASEVIVPRFVEIIVIDNMVSCEIIAAHLYIERGIPFTFLPLIFDL